MPSEQLINTKIVFTAFHLLVSLMLAYFSYISWPKLKGNTKNHRGLIYLALAFLLYCVFGIYSHVNPVPVEGQIPIAYLIINGLISLCFLSALPFLSTGTGKTDQLVTSSGWNQGIKYFGFAYVVMVAVSNTGNIMQIVDQAMTAIAMAALCYFLFRYFQQRRMLLLSLVTLIFFSFWLFLQFATVGYLSEGKFVHPNTVILGPALFFSVIIMAYTFNWINELTFYELSRMWTDEGETAGTPAGDYAHLLQNDNKQVWLDKLAKDEIEDVISELLIYKKHRHEPIEDVLNIAARNSRNNNNQLRDLIKYDDYQLNRNKVANALMTLLQA